MESLGERTELAAARTPGMVTARQAANGGTLANEPALGRRSTMGGSHQHEERKQPDPNVHFFVCHAHEDGDFAENVKHRMAAEGFVAWIDTDSLLVGVDWRQEIDDTIREAAAVVLVVTPAAKISEYVTYEWALAWGLGIPVIPVMLKPTSLHPRLETFQFLDFTNRAARPWGRLKDALATIAKRQRESSFAAESFSLRSPFSLPEGT
jgi:hypothetical protein